MIEGRSWDFFGTVGPATRTGVSLNDQDQRHSYDMQFQDTTPHVGYAWVPPSFVRQSLGGASCEVDRKDHLGKVLNLATVVTDFQAEGKDGRLPQHATDD